MVVKKNGLFTARLTVRVWFWSGCCDFFQNKLKYFDLFYHFIMGKIGPKFSHLLTVRAKGADPPLPPLTVSLTVKRPFFFLTTSFIIWWWQWPRQIHDEDTYKDKYKMLFENQDFLWYQYDQVSQDLDWGSFWSNFQQQFFGFCFHSRWPSWHKKCIDITLCKWSWRPLWQVGKKSISRFHSQSGALFGWFCNFPHQVRCGAGVENCQTCTKVDLVGCGSG